MKLASWPSYLRVEAAAAVLVLLLFGSARPERADAHRQEEAPSPQQPGGRAGHGPLVVGGVVAGAVQYGERSEYGVGVFLVDGRKTRQDKSRLKVDLHAGMLRVSG